MSKNMLSPIVIIAIGVIYSVMTLMVPDATIGRPMEPKIFPAILGTFLTILGISLFIGEILKQKKNSEEVKSIKFSIGENEKKIIITVVNGVLYAILFPVIGYVFSTFIFLEIQLFIFGELKSWKTSTLVAIIFSTVAFVIFNVLLGIYLPKSPLGWI